MVKIKHEKVLENLDFIENVYQETVENLTAIKEDLLEAIAEDKDIDDENERRFYIHEVQSLNPENLLGFYRFARLFKHVLTIHVLQR